MAIVIVLFFSFAMSAVAFGPLKLKRFRIGKPPKTQFQMTDVFVLAVQLQIAAGVVHILSTQIELIHDVQIESTILVFVLLIAWWWAGVKMLSSKQIQEAKYRIGFLAFAVPLGFSSAMLSPAILLGCGGLLLLAAFPIFIAENNVGQWQRLVPQCLHAIAWGASVGAGINCCRKICRYLDQVARRAVVEAP